VSDVETTTDTYITNTVNTRVADADETIPYRFVGSYEYRNALAAFEKLVSISTAEELAAYDKVLNERPEFTYFNGANALLAVPPNLKVANIAQRTNYYDTFRKQGLAWMMALAKVELSATASMYGKTNKPFQMLPTTQFDYAAYVQVLADDAVAHMRSLSQEAGFKEATRRGKKIDTWTIAYLRRLKLIRDMLSTLGEVGTQDVKLRLQPYDKELAKYEERLFQEVANQTGSKTSTSYGQSQRTGRSFQAVGKYTGSIQQCVDMVKRSNKESGGSRSREKLSVSN